MASSRPNTLRSLIASKRDHMVTPALLTSTSRLPKRASVFATSAAQSSGRETSPGRISTSAPRAVHSRAASARRASLRALSARRGLSAASARASARPMPSEAPVINTVLPVNVLICNHSVSERRAAAVDHDNGDELAVAATASAVGALQGGPGGRRGAAAGSFPPDLLRARAPQRHRSRRAATGLCGAEAPAPRQASRWRHPRAALLLLSDAAARRLWRAARPTAAGTARTDDRRAARRSAQRLRPGAGRDLLGTRAAERG